MKKFVTTFLFFLIGFTMSCPAQSVWKISRDDIQKSSYLIMTDPYIETSFISTMKGLDEASTNTDIIYCELTPQDFEEGMPSLEKYIILPQENNLKGFLTDSSFNYIKQTIQQYGNDTLAAIFQVLHPDFTRLCLSSETQTIGGKATDIDQIIDFALIKQLSSDNRPVMGFESFENVMQLGFPADIIGNRAQSLLQFCQTIPNSRTLNKRITQAYRNGDLLILDQLINEKKRSGQSERIDHMNQKWTARIITVIHDEPAIFVINDTYALGKNGIFELLRKKG
ncbi:MAG: TraB/GumN family protein, partial [Bacteroidales bacterium]